MGERVSLRAAAVTAIAIAILLLLAVQAAPVVLPYAYR